MNFGTNCFSHMNRTPGGVFFFVIIMPREITFSIKLHEKHKLSGSCVGFVCICNAREKQ